MEFVFDEEKNKKLFKQRGVTFEQVIETIANDKVLHDMAHPNKDKYPHQRLMIVELDNYTYGVPYLQNEEEIVLKTIYPDRRYKKLMGKKDDKN